ncbi:DUF6502 family protein [Ideonella sp. DXS22W]|uniref:DUF6502 family protein n=1 Tax=Pseudaquabacterium inlustre TaxID=2984192 RepID=A0ABU9CEW8_9BURK
MSPTDTAPPHPAPADALAGALRQLLGPLARLALARGVTHATLDELLKQALVDAADRQHAALPPHRRVSRISTATGIHRREVTRLVGELRDGAAQAAPPQRSLASELFAHWRTHRDYCDRRGSPAELPRQGPAPSFESLAQAITRDVHPRSLLDELLRLGLAAHDRERDTVRLLREDFVPSGDAARMLRSLGNNVGDHLQAAVDNVLSDAPRHFEQAVFAGGLSAASVAEIDRLLRARWGELVDALVPALETLIARDAAALADAASDAEGAAPPPVPRQRVRLGLYALAQDLPAPDAPESPR